METIIPYIVFGCFLLFGSFLLLLIVLAAWEGLRTRRWPATVGKVVRSGIATEVEVSDPQERLDTSILHGPEVVYEYQVGGEKCTGNTVQTGKVKTSSPRWAQRIAGRYQPGDDVLVYYNPAEPTEAVLEPGVPSGLAIFSAIAIPIFAIGLVGVLAVAGWVRIEQGQIQLLIGGVVALVGLALVWMAVRNLRLGAASRSWPTTEGRVIATVVRNWTTKNSTHREPHVVYEYEVDGTRYAHSALDLGSGVSWQTDEVSAKVDRYPAGTPVTVYYDPTRPERAVLEPGPRWSNLFYLCVGLPFFVVGTVLVAARFVA